jgi:hypothetical protein
MIPAGPDPTTMTSHVFSHHADSDDEAKDDDAVAEGGEIDEVRVFCPLATKENARKRTRWIAVEGETIWKELHRK